MIKYSTPEMDVIVVETADILTGSTEQPGQGGGNSDTELGDDEF